MSAAQIPSDEGQVQTAMPWGEAVRLAPPLPDAVADELAALGVVMRQLQDLVDANNRAAAIRVWQHAGQWLQVPVPR